MNGHIVGAFDGDGFQEAVTIERYTVTLGRQTNGNVALLSKFHLIWIIGQIDREWCLRQNGDFGERGVSGNKSECI